MWKVVKGLLSIVLGSAVFLLVLFVLSYILHLLASIPFLGSILYYPSNAGWAKIVLPPASGIFAGAYVGKIICGSTKPFSVFAILVYGINLILGFMMGQLTWAVVGTAVVVFVSAFVCFSDSRN